MKIQKRKDFIGFLEFQQDLESGETCLSAAEECTCLQLGRLEEMPGSNKGNNGSILGRPPHSRRILSGSNGY